MTDNGTLHRRRLVLRCRKQQSPATDHHQPAGRIANVPTGVIPTLQVFLNIQHTFNSDLNVSLSNPDGTSVALFTNVRGASDGFFINLADRRPPISGRHGSFGTMTSRASNPEGIALDCRCPRPLLSTWRVPDAPWN